MFSNFIVGLLVVLVVLYLTKFIRVDEGFRVFNSNSNIYESIGTVPNKILYLSPPNSSQPNVDYQDWLNEVSGYDAGTRGYSNPIYAVDVAAGLNTN